MRTAVDAGDSEAALPEIVQALERHRVTAEKVDDAIKVRCASAAGELMWIDIATNPVLSLRNQLFMAIGEAQ